MKITATSTLFLFLFLLKQTGVFSQQTENWLESTDLINISKLYLHTDREFYFQGDSIWFKGYYLDGQTQHLVPGTFSMYVNLIDFKGQLVQKMVLPIIDGEAIGNLIILDSLKQGNYLLQAYTDFQKALGQDTFFHKILKISKLKSSSESTDIEPTISEERIPEIDVRFLPEGGFLLAGQMNVLAYKAIDKSGRAISIKGEILNSEGKVVSSFASKYKGMDTIHFSPKPGESYKVRIEGFPNYENSINDIVKEGIKLEYRGDSGDSFLFQTRTNSKLLQGKSYYFAIMHRGRVIFYKEFIQNDQHFPIKVNRAALPGGINRFVLLDKDLKPISERLLFSINYEINDIKIEPDKDKYKTRRKVNLEIFDEEEIADDSFSSLSISVIDETAVGENGPELNILSWLLIDSELKGNIENPNDYFINEDNLSSESKLDFLMLTQGWSNYIYNSISKRIPIQNIEEVEGISIKGRVNKLLSKKPVVNGDVFLNISQNNYFYSVGSITDEEGRFSFDSIFFADTAFAFMQARNSKGKLSTEIVLDSIFENNPRVSKIYLPVKRSFTDFPVQLYQQQYFNEQDLRDYLLKSGSILIEGVTIEGQKRENDDGHYRIYTKPYNSLKVTERDVTYRNVADYLQGRVAGVVVVGNSIMIRGPGSFGGPSTPLFLLDGTPMKESDIIMSIPMSDIDIVEVLKNPGETAIFGTDGGNGVISVFTKK
ncbi:MAG: TonB-dependent receptor plug domain-containing protein, partial [Bacteroidales bacterium]|nr:TonB-dependent receptor plug domain-containing protein [Bacteroidales bacterium]